MAAILFEFEWDPAKARTNFRKHGLHFETASQVFLDPLAVTIQDEEHSDNEIRWITLGKDTSGHYVLVVHTFVQVNDRLAQIRLISARRPTRAEISAYEEVP